MVFGIRAPKESVSTGMYERTAGATRVREGLLGAKGNSCEFTKEHGGRDHLFVGIFGRDMTVAQLSLNQSARRSGPTETLFNVQLTRLKER